MFSCQLQVILMRGSLCKEMLKSCIHDPLCQAKSLYINEGKPKCIIKLNTAIRTDIIPI